MQILGVHHVAIHTPHLDRLRAFYVGTLGLPVAGGWPELGILFVGAGSTVIELIADSDGGRRGRQGWHHLAWEVADLDAAHAELSERGVVFHVPPEDFPPDAPTYRIAFFKDPDGNVVELIQPLSGPT